ncbi:MAG TPA: hypothetical protein VNK67_13390 [Burkholderiales bacterium]|nr:hypothetical protein [Burkholderiales bacterium]
MGETSLFSEQMLQNAARSRRFVQSLREALGRRADEMQRLSAGLSRREARVQIGGQILCVREPAAGDQLDDLSSDPDAAYKLIVTCTYDADGNRVFTDDDIPALKAASRGYVRRLVENISRVLISRTFTYAHRRGARPARAA